MRKTLGNLLAIFPVSISFVASASGNLLTNGDFEANRDPLGRTRLGITSITGWSVIAGTVDLQSSTDAGGLQAQSGLQCLETVGTPGHATIQQTFGTTPGRTYFFEGWKSHHPGISAGTAAVFINGQRIGTISHNTPVGNRGGSWEPFCLAFTATSSSTTLRIQDITFVYEKGGMVFDNLSVNDVFETPDEIAGVILPPIHTDISAYVSYDSYELSLEFHPTEQAMGDTYFEYASDEGTLDLEINYYGLSLSAESSTSATLTGFKPRTLMPIPVCQFVDGARRNECLINGPFDADHYYARWRSPGFSVDACIPVLNLLCIFRLPYVQKACVSSPLEYWVDMDRLGVAPTGSLDTVLRTLENYIHTRLTLGVVVPCMAGAVPESSRTRVTLTTRPTYNRATRTFNGAVTITNTSSEAIVGPIQLVVEALPLGVTLDNASGYTNRILNLGLPSPFITVKSTTNIAPGRSITVPLRFRNPSGQIISGGFEVWAGIL